MKVAIVGYGFVGKAVSYGFTGCHQMKIDPFHFDNDVADLVEWNPDVTFVCVPTPMAEDKSIDASIVKDVVDFLKDNVVGLIVIKSTVTPDNLTLIRTGANADRIIYNPEFLTERNAQEDFINPRMHVLGGEYSMTKKLQEIYEQYSLCKPCPVYHMTPEEASFVKYGINCFLATKVLWFNQFYDIVEGAGASNFTKVINAISEDERVGGSHTRVPGFDGKRGYGGACFPKDTTALVNTYKHMFPLLEKVIEENNKYRAMYDKDEREIAQGVKYD